MADSTVKIDVLLEGDQAQQKSKELDEMLSNIGKDAGDKASDSIKKNMDESANTAKTKTEEIVDDFKKIPKETLIKLKTQAEKQGITNYAELLKKLPKKTLTKLVSEASDGKVINYEKLLRQLPTKVITSVKLNDNASPQLTALKKEAIETEHSFSRLHDMIAGSFIGNIAANGFNTLTGYIHDMAHEALSASDAINKFQSTMKLGGWGENEIKSSAKEVQKYANDTVYELNDVSNTAAQLASNGIKNYMQLTEAAGNLNAQAGGTADTFKSVAMVMTQTAGEGKLTAENWNQLIDAIPGASGVLQEQMKKNGAYTGNFRDAMAQGKISADDLNKAMLQLGTNKGAVEAAKSTSTFEGAFGNLRAQVVTGIQEMIEKLGKKRMTDIINTVTDSVLGLTKFILKLFEVISEHRKIAVGLGAVLTAAFATKKITDFIMYLGRAKKAMVEFGLASKAVDLIGGNGSPIATLPGKGVIAATGASTASRLLSFAGRAVPIGTAAFAVGNELTSSHSTGQKVGGSTGAIAGSMGGAALGGAIGTMIAPGIGTAVGEMLGGSVGTWAGAKLGEALGKGASDHLKAHPVTVNTKYKVSKDNSNFDKNLTPDINKVNTTVLRMDVDSASIQAAQQKTDKYYSEMSKKVDDYYNKKAKGYQKDEAASKKNLDTLVKNGEITQAQADKDLIKMQNRDKSKIKADQNAATARKKVLQQMQQATNDYYAQVQKIENDSSKSETQKRTAIQKAQQKYVQQQYRNQLAVNKKIGSYVKQGADNQKKIYTKLIKQRGQLDMKDLKATQKAANQKYKAAVEPAKKARNEIIKEAKKQKAETIKAAKKERYEYHSISNKKYKEIVADAKSQEKGVEKAANKEYSVTTKKARDQHKKVTNEVNKQKSEVVSAANTQAVSHGAAAGQEYTLVNANVQSGQKKTASSMNSFHNWINKLLKVFSANQSVPMIGYATGTGALTHNQLAMVGEEGFELAHGPKGYEVLGAKGPELRYLSAGTSILTHQQSKLAMMMNGGKVPGYAKGTGANIKDFLPDSLDKAGAAFDDIFELIDKGASEIWSWIKSHLGIDKAINTFDPKWLNQVRGRGVYEIDGKAGASFLKKMLDKFMESFGGAITGDHGKLMAAAGIPASWFGAINYIVSHESGWRVNATNPSSGAYGLPQALPGSKMASAGKNWRTNPITQLKWMKSYVTERYGGGPQAAAYWRAHHNYANGGWADETSIFGEVPGEPELAVNPARNSSEEHIAEAIEARAKINPNGFAGSLSKLIEGAKQSAQNIMPVFNGHNGTFQSNSNPSVINATFKGNIENKVLLDGKVVARTTYPYWKAIRSHEMRITKAGGAVPVGNALPLGGVY